MMEGNFLVEPVRLWFLWKNSKPLCSGDTETGRLRYHVSTDFSGGRSSLGVSDRSAFVPGRCPSTRVHTERRRRWEVFECSFVKQILPFRVSKHSALLQFQFNLSCKFMSKVEFDSRSMLGWWSIDGFPFL